MSVSVLNAPAFISVDEVSYVHANLTQALESCALGQGLDGVCLMLATVAMAIENLRDTQNLNA